MRAQTQEEMRNDPFAELDEFADDYEYASVQDIPSRTTRRAQRRPVYRRAPKRHGWGYYLGTYAITAALALTTHLVMRSPVPERYDGNYDYWSEDVVNEQGQMPPAVISLEGAEYSLPCELGHFMDVGWEVNTFDGYWEDFFPAGETNLYMELSKGTTVVFANVDKPEGQGDIPVRDGVVTYVGVEQSDYPVTPYGVRLGMSVDELVNILDENIPEYTRSYYRSADGYYSSEDFDIYANDYSMTITVIDNVVADVSVNYYNW